MLRGSPQRGQRLRGAQKIFLPLRGAPRCIFFRVDDIRKRRQKLTLVSDAGRAPAAVRELDWSILMAHAQNGEREAYRRLLGEITPYLRSLAAKSHRDACDVEDTVQDVLLTIHAIRHTYDPARPFGPWLVAIARRRIADRLRRQGRSRSRETALAPEHESVAAPETMLDEARSEAIAVRDAIQRLPPGQREAITLTKLQEMSLKQAATVSGMSIAALKVATHRALKSLRKTFGQEGDEP
jgi:RNA polymerase sigma-70 factor (ECF subfamily)